MQVKHEAGSPLADSVAQELLLVLSHVFEQVRLPPFVQADQQIRVQESPSK